MKKTRKPKPVIIKSRQLIHEYRAWRLSQSKLQRGLRSMLSHECVAASASDIFAEVYNQRYMIPSEWWGNVVAHAYTRTHRGETTIAELIKVFIRNSR